ncbi:MAG: hypothetical protein U1D00_22665 [Mycobacterium sp.]|nr:hypothetical protein [Mycobacterium sp.]
MTLVAGAAWVFGVAGILLGLAALAAFRQPLLALRVMLDLFLAAGLLRLAVDQSWATIAGTVAVIAVRRLITRDLNTDFTAALARAPRTRW